MAGIKKYQLTDVQIEKVKVNRITTSIYGYKGIDFDKRSGTWRAYIGCRRQGNLVRLNGFADAKDAAQAYDQLARDRYGEDAFVNFPLNGEKKIQVKKDGFCGLGHEMTEDNTYLVPRGSKQCRRCLNLNVIRYARRDPVAHALRRKA